MSITYLNNVFINEPIYAGFHNYYNSYKVLTRKGIIYSQISSEYEFSKGSVVSINYSKLLDPSLNISEEGELGIILSIETQYSGGKYLIPTVSELTQSDVKMKKYFYESYMLLTLRSKFSKFFLGNIILERIKFLDFKKNNCTFQIFYKWSYKSSDFIDLSMMNKLKNDFNYFKKELKKELKEHNFKVRFIESKD